MFNLFRLCRKDEIFTINSFDIVAGVDRDLDSRSTMQLTDIAYKHC